jgi:hypothetical protein
MDIWDEATASYHLLLVRAASHRKCGVVRFLCQELLSDASVMFIRKRN